MYRSRAMVLPWVPFAGVAFALSDPESETFNCPPQVYCPGGGSGRNHDPAPTE